MSDDSHPILTAVGVLAVAVGVLMVVQPGLAAAVGTGRAAITIVGELAVVQAIRVVRSRRAADLQAAETPDVETVATVATPGEEFDRRVAGFRSDPRRVQTREREQLRETLEDAALTAIADRDNCSRERARERLADGTWTDDPHAAAFLGGTAVPSPPFLDRVRLALRPETRVQFRIERTADAVARTAGVEPDADEPAGPTAAGDAGDGLGRATETEGPERATETDGTGRADRDGGRARADDTDANAQRGGRRVRAVRRTERWRGVSAVALLAGGLGVLFSRPLVLLSGVVGVAFAAYARTASEPAVALDAERTVSDDEPLPGDEVRVRVTVENVGDATLPDLRLVDGVPDALPVTDGSARLGTALRPGKSASFSYAVEAERGDHEFDPLTAVARDFSGSVEVETDVECETTLRCVPKLGTTADVPLRAQTTRYTGRVTTDDGGAGVEFHATREYRPGDPLSRVDWNRLARTGELTTVEFREERAASVVVLVDTREEAYLSPDDEERNAVQYGVDAAGKIVTKLLDAGDRVGLASFGPENCWLAPGAGHDHQARARDLLATHPAFAPTPTAELFYPRTRLKQLRKRLPAASQVVFVTPLCDDFGVEVARRLDAEGHLVTVVSPDPTATGSPGQRFARVRRGQRLSTLRQAGLGVVDWDTDESLGVALSRMARLRGATA